MDVFHCTKPGLCRYGLCIVTEFVEKRKWFKISLEHAIFITRSKAKVRYYHITVITSVLLSDIWC